jgi:hypothetical protein
MSKQNNVAKTSIPSSAHLQSLYGIVQFLKHPQIMMMALLVDYNIYSRAEIMPPLLPLPLPLVIMTTMMTMPDALPITVLLVTVVVVVATMTLMTTMMMPMMPMMPQSLFLFCI